MNKVVMFLMMILSTSAFANKKILLTNANTIVLSEEISDASVAEVIEQAQKLDTHSVFSDSSQPIYLILKTPGGSVIAGMQLISVLSHLHRPVHTITLFSASMGFHTVQGLGKRYVTSDGVLMSHRAKGGIDGEMGGTVPSQIQTRLKFFLDALLDMDEQTVKRSKGKQTLESYQRAYSNELWIMGQHAVDAGYADEVVSFDCSDSLSGTITKQTEFMGLSIQYDVNKCPLTITAKNVRALITTQYGTMTYDEFTARNGQLTPECHLGSNLCSSDAGLTAEKIKTILKEFKTKQSDMKILN